MKRLLMVILVVMMAVPGMGAVSKIAVTNPYIDQAKDPKGMGVAVMISYWVRDAALMDPKAVIAGPNLCGLVPMDLALGLSYLCHTTKGAIWGNSDVIDTLRAMVARETQSEGERNVAVIGLLFITHDAQSIDLSLDFLLGRPQQRPSISATLRFLTEECVLTRAQIQRIAAVNGLPPHR